MHRGLIVVLAAALAVVGAGTGIAFASIPGPDGVVHGCYKTSSPAQGTLTVIDSAASCPSGTASLNWNQAGPQGPAGSPGISGYQVVTKAETDPPFADYGHQSVQCPAGKVPLGGGGTFAWVNTGDNVADMANSAPTSDGWQVGWVAGSIGGESGDATLTGYAVCANVSS